MDGSNNKGDVKFVETVNNGQVIIKTAEWVGQGVVDLKEDVPNIVIETRSPFGRNIKLVLTWDEAKELGRSLVAYADLMEFG